MISYHLSSAHTLILHHYHHYENKSLIITSCIVPLNGPSALWYCSRGTWIRLLSLLEASLWFSINVSIPPRVFIHPSQGLHPPLSVTSNSTRTVERHNVMLCYSCRVKISGWFDNSDLDVVGIAEHMLYVIHTIIVW